MRSGSRLWAVAVLGLALSLAAACGDGLDPDAAPAPEASIVTPPDGSVPPLTSPVTSAPTGTTRRSATTTTVPADLAPDFALDLGNGGTFVLSEEARPVFMVFWAEW